MPSVTNHKNVVKPKMKPHKHKNTELNFPLAIHLSYYIYIYKLACIHIYTCQYNAETQISAN